MTAKAEKAKIAIEQENAGGAVTFEQIAARAYAIHLSGAGGDELENWLRAESELNAELYGASDRGAGHDIEQHEGLAA